MDQKRLGPLEKPLRIRIRRRRIAPTRRIRRDKKRRKRREL
jgi:hypothetical protein